MNVKKIDNALDNYYRFTKNDWNNLLQKLSPREKQCLTDIKEELKCHICNNYCELGICDKTWDWQFLDDNKLNF